MFRVSASAPIPGVYRGGNGMMYERCGDEFCESPRVGVGVDCLRYRPAGSVGLK